MNRLVGSRVAARREALGLPVGELAARADIPLDRLREQEAGDARISADELRRLGEVLGAPPSDFLPRSPDELSLKRD